MIRGSLPGTIERLDFHLYPQGKRNGNPEPFAKDVVPKYAGQEIPFSPS